MLGIRYHLFELTVLNPGGGVILPTFETKLHVKITLHGRQQLQTNELNELYKNS